MQKAERQNTVLDLISGQTVRRQDELAALLHARGFDVTQASVSRDLDELGIVKVDGQYARPSEAAVPSSPFGIAGIETAGENVIVVKCASGLASAAAVQIDAEKIADIVGTIAGDDTIFIAVKGPAPQKAVIKKIRTLFASV
jgi:transcriptional regulator of arginine metabolism